MAKIRHHCHLAVKDTSGLPRLAPNATCFQKFVRKLWIFLLLNPSHFKCREMFRNKSSVLAERQRHANSRYFYVIHPLSIFNIIIQIIFFFLWMYGFVCEAILIMDFHEQHFNAFNQIVVIPGRLIMVLLLFNIGYIDKKTKQIIINSKKIVVRYLRTYFFFDLLTTYWLQKLAHKLLYYKVVVGSELFVFRCETFLEILSVAACCVRINTLLGFMEDTLITFKCGKLVRFFMLRFLKTFIYLHIFTCFVFFVPHLIYGVHQYPSGSWLTQANLDADTPISIVYFECFLVTASYFFGIAEKYDMGLVHEEICIAIVSFSGRMYTLFLLADVLNTLGIVGVSESKYERQASVLNQYMSANNLPEELRQRMLKYIEFKFQGHYFKESDIIGSLSETLRTELFLFSAAKLIKKVEIFKKLPNSALGAMIAGMKSEIYSSGDVIVMYGSELHDIYFISSGTVAVINKRNNELCHLEDGDSFGTGCLLAVGQTYSVVAVETTEVFFIDKDLFLKFLQPYPDVMNDYYRAIRQRLLTLKGLEEKCTEGKMDIMDDLQKGRILEKLTKRPEMNLE